MKKETRKVWKEMEELGWSNEPKDFHLEYFEDIIEATKQAFSLQDIGSSYPAKNTECKECKTCEGSGVTWHTKNK
jgi:hypothetical protein